MEETNVLESVGPIVATADPASGEAVLAALDRRIRDLESAVGDLRTIKAHGEQAGRKTVPAAQVSVLAKGAANEGGDAPLEDAMRSLSIEQRFAVKSGLIRAGLLR
jgi:hypothetical protein